jgi:RNA polymerase sigma factor (sigma-70 family)
MKRASSAPGEERSVQKEELHFLFHPSFEEVAAERTYGAAPADGDDSSGFLSDDSTRDWARRMHYAAWRTCRARDRREAARWRRRYHECRDRIVLGNRKLTFRAVQKWAPPRQLIDDLAGECQIVLIKAVAAFNPWLGIRFSTYAFTCLLRALSRLSQRLAADRLSRALPLAALPAGEPSYVKSEEPAGPATERLDDYLRPENPLLTPREKTILLRRYYPGAGRMETLDQVGHALGLSKERVRQLQNTALGKLRAALLAEAPKS